MYIMQNFLKFSNNEVFGILFRLKKLLKSPKVSFYFIFGAVKRKKPADDSESAPKKSESSDFTPEELKILIACGNNPDKLTMAAIEFNRKYLRNILTPELVTDLLIKTMYSLPKEFPPEFLQFYKSHKSNQNLNNFDDIIEILTRHMIMKNKGYGSNLVMKYGQKYYQERKKEILKVKEVKESKPLPYDFSSDALFRIFDLLNSRQNQIKNSEMAKNFLSFLFIFNKIFFLKSNS